MSTEHWEPINNLPWADLKLDVYRNEVGRDCHVRLIHIPTGIVAEGYHDSSTTEARHIAELELERRLKA